METTELKEQLKPHPTQGWIAVIPIPGSEIMAPESEEPEEPQIINMGPIQMMATQINQQASPPSIIAALVLETCPPPGLELPYGPGDTIYMHSDRGYDIGDYRFVLFDKAICYTPGSHHEDEGE